MKKIIVGIIGLMCVAMLCSCAVIKNRNVPRDESIRFKGEYEGLNGTSNAKGTPYREVSLPEANPIYYVSAATVNEMIDNKETFFVYFGDTKCPWCRSVVEKMISIANEKEIEKLYYVPIWDEEHNEVVRDVYTLDKKNNPVLKSEGCEVYKDLLKKFDSVLNDYTLTTAKGDKVNVGEKRIFAPNIFFIKSGKVVNMVSGNSELQKASNDELTEEILKDEEKIFNEFFSQK